MMIFRGDYISRLREAHEKFKDAPTDFGPVHRSYDRVEMTIPRADFPFVRVSLAKVGVYPSYIEPMGDQVSVTFAVPPGVDFG